jgi:hypothetical protein
MAEQEQNWWDPDSHSSGSYLDGKRGVITEAAFIRHNYKGKGPEKTAFQFRVELPDVDEDKQPFPISWGVGPNHWPSRDRKTKDTEGPFLIHPEGKKVDKRSVFHTGFKALAGTGFPMKDFAENGADAFLGAEFTFKGLDKEYDIEGKHVEAVYNVPAEFHGFTSGAAGPPAPKDESEVIGIFQKALLSALDKQPEIPRAQLSIRLNEFLADNPRRTAVLALISRDDVLGGLEGIVFDKKTVRKA